MNKVYNKEFVSYLVKVIKTKGFKAMVEESKKRWEKAKLMGIVTLFLFMVLPVHAETYVLKYTLSTSSYKQLPVARSARDAGSSATSSPNGVKKLAPSVSNEIDYIKTKKHAATLLRIFALESGMGSMDACRLKGLGYNGIGLGESDEYIRQHGPNCFSTFQALWDEADRKLVEWGVDKSLSTALCIWNTGRSLPSCPYYRHFMNL